MFSPTKKAQIDRARDFAIQAHGDQIRKYTHEPYWNHCEAVAKKVEEMGGSHEQVMAAWLHDTIEDTWVIYEDLEAEFGAKVSNLVAELTDQYVLQADMDRKLERRFKHFLPCRGITWGSRVVQVVMNPTMPTNRKARKALERACWTTNSFEAKFVKLADQINNASSIKVHDPKFWATYCEEIKAMLPILRIPTLEKCTKPGAGYQTMFSQLEDLIRA